MVTYTAKVHRFRDESLASLWSYHLLVPAEVAEPFLQGDDRRVVITYPSGLKQQCALMPRGEGDCFIFLNQKLRKTLSLEPDDEITIRIEADTSKYGLPVPEELEVLLDQDEEGSQFFHQLTPGKQRTLIHWVGSVKNPDKRLTRAVVMINHVKGMRGNVDFKQLNEALKGVNQPGG